MSIANGLLGDLRIADVLTFLTVHRCGNISAAARELMVTPSQVSKSIGRVEELLGARLLSRGPNGVGLLDEGQRVVGLFEKMLALTRQLGNSVGNAPQVLSFAAPSFVATYFLPYIAASEPSFRIRGLELPPAQIRAQLSSGFFDVAITLGELPLAPSWQSHRVGEVEKALFAAPETAAALGPGPLAVARLAELPIISPIYVADGAFLPVDDEAPISRRDRVVGHEAMTLALGLALATRTRQLVFGPTIGALGLIQIGQLVKLEVEGWRKSDPLFLSYNAERITTGEQRALIVALARGLAAAQAA